MALPTRVNRQSGYEAYDPIQREFDSMLGRFFGGAARGRRRSHRTASTSARMPIIFMSKPNSRASRKMKSTLPWRTRRSPSPPTVTSEQKQEDGNKGDWLLHERRHTRFLRSFTLPPTVSEQKVDAKLNDGVLTITLDKREETKPRKIQVG